MYPCDTYGICSIAVRGIAHTKIATTIVNECHYDERMASTINHTHGLPFICDIPYDTRTLRFYVCMHRLNIQWDSESYNSSNSDSESYNSAQWTLCWQPRAYKAACTRHRTASPFTWLYIVKLQCVRAYRASVYTTSARINSNAWHAEHRWRTAARDGISSFTLHRWYIKCTKHCKRRQVHKAIPIRHTIHNEKIVTKQKLIRQCSI